VRLICRSLWFISSLDEGTRRYHMKGSCLRFYSNTDGKDFCGRIAAHLTITFSATQSAQC
jgi:hypothetical protein